MKPFTKKLDLTFLILSIAVALVGSVLVAASGVLLPLIHNFLETQIFHRTFDMGKWTPTMNALITFPIFFGIAFDSIFFIKFSNKSKIILLSVYLVLVVFFLAFCAAVNPESFMDSDMASDILLGKECWIKKSILPRSWYYSTEIRLLNMQLFFAPVFAFTSNWHIVKAVASPLLCLLLPLSVWFLLSQLKVKTTWVKLLASLIILSPWSMRSWLSVQFGNYYVTLVANTFFYAGLCLSLMFNENSEKKQKAFKILFFVLAFLLGLSSIRYILQILFPMALVVVFIAVKNFLEKNQNFNIKEFFIDDRIVFYPMSGLLIGGFGFFCNSTILAHFYSFADFGSMNFNEFNSVPIMQWVFDILRIFGYRDMVSVFTPAGIINVLVYVLLVFILIFTIKFIKDKELTKNHRIFILFSVVMFIFNAFVFINTDYYDRYMLILQLCFFPCIIIFMFEPKFFILNRYILGVTASLVLISSTFVTFSSVLTTKRHAEEKDVSEFLVDSGYTFGYATFWNANTMSFFTDGKVEIANLDNKKVDGNSCLLDDFKCDYWLTPKRYYEDDYKNNEKIFLLVSAEELNCTPEHNLFKYGKKVYNNENYTVFEYKDKEMFKNSF